MERRETATNTVKDVQEKLNYNSQYSVGISMTSQCHKHFNNTILSLPRHTVLADLNDLSLHEENGYVSSFSR